MHYGQAHSCCIISVGFPLPLSASYHTYKQKPLRQQAPAVMLVPATTTSCRKWPHQILPAMLSIFLVRGRFLATGTHWLPIVKRPKQRIWLLPSTLVHVDEGLTSYYAFFNIFCVKVWPHIWLLKYECMSPKIILLNSYLKVVIMLFLLCSITYILLVTIMAKIWPGS